MDPADPGRQVETDTSAIRKHYRSTGLDLAAILKVSIDSELERGRELEHGDYPTEHKPTWDFPMRERRLTPEQEPKHPIQATCSAFREATKHFFIEDAKSPYVQAKPFQWVQGDQVGGKSLLWGRGCYRMSDLDFTANLQDGHGVDWPIRYADLAPWYSHVERHVGISGAREFMVDNAVLLQAAKPDGKAGARERAAQNTGVESSGMQTGGAAPGLETTRPQDRFPVPAARAGQRLCFAGGWCRNRCDGHRRFRAGSCRACAVSRCPNAFH